MQKMTCMTYKSINGIHASYETYALICLNMKNMHEIWINIPAGLLDRLQGDIARVLIRPATFNTCQPIAGPPKCVLKRGGIRQSVLLEEGGGFGTWWSLHARTARTCPFLPLRRHLRVCRLSRALRTLSLMCTRTTRAGTRCVSMPQDCKKAANTMVTRASTCETYYGHAARRVRFHHHQLQVPCWVNAQLVNKMRALLAHALTSNLAGCVRFYNVRELNKWIGHWGGKSLEGAAVCQLNSLERGNTFQILYPELGRKAFRKSSLQKKSSTERSGKRPCVWKIAVKYAKYLKYAKYVFYAYSCNSITEICN